MSVRQDGRRPPAVSREQPSPAVRARVQWTGTGRETHISKHTRVASAAAAGGDENASQLHRRELHNKGALPTGRVSVTETEERH